MNFEQNKFGHPFNGGNQYFNQLSARIQQRAGIEVVKINDHVEPKIEFAKKEKQMPIQLTVEFGFPLTAEKIEKEDNEILDITDGFENVIPTKQTDIQSDIHVSNTNIGEIHIEPLNVQPNSTPYWHEFNADDELEGLVLDSDGQEMSDIIIHGDGQLDLDHQIFHEIIPQDENISLIIDEDLSGNASLLITDESLPLNVVKEDSLVIPNEINLENVLLDNDIVKFGNQEIVANDEVLELSLPTNDEVMTNIVSNDISDEMVAKTETIQTSEEIVNEEKRANNELSITDEVPTFSFSFIPEVAEITEIEPQIQLEIAEDNSIETIVSEELEMVSDPIVEENTSRIEMSYSSADLDAIHEEFSARKISPKNEKSDKIAPKVEINSEFDFSDADLDMLHNQMSQESLETYEKSSVGKTVHIPVFEDATNGEVEAKKATVLDVIPWSSVFGVVASLMAIASAWFIWNSIQKPIAIDEFIDKAIVVAPVSNPVSPATISSDAEVILSPAEYIVTSILEDANNIESEPVFRFSDLSERSKVSAVELEKLGLTCLNLEDNFFEEPIF